MGSWLIQGWREGEVEPYTSMYETDVSMALLQIQVMLENGRTVKVTLEYLVTVPETTSSPNL